MSQIDAVGAREVFVDVRVRSMLIGEARRRAVTRVFGVPANEQTLLVTLILFGAAAQVVRGLTPALPRPSRSDAAMGATVVNTGLGGIAGAPAATVPFAGALIALALVSHSLRPTVAGAIHEIRTFAHGLAVALGVPSRR